jgi:hypothetical protein
MPKKKAAVAQARTVTVVSSAPGYDPYARSAAAPGTSVTAPGGPYAIPVAVGPVAITPPPPRAPQEPFINAQFLWALGKPVRATILGVRDATGTGNTQFARPGQAAKRAWFLDFVLENNTKATGRINEGDTRHQRLWAAYQAQWLNRQVTLRLTNPGDMDALTGKPSKAAWMLDAQ